MYYRSVSSAGEYEKVVARAEARSLALDHLMPDTGYEVKMQAYTQQAPSEFSSILVSIPVYYFVLTLLLECLSYVTCENQALAS